MKDPSHQSENEGGKRHRPGRLLVKEVAAGIENAGGETGPPSDHVETGLAIENAI